mmetsp:Transcript_391/g.1087  ORF Transcript_391/g.1087 Transcript_391/m.1087 type:complete len:129 (-) Transcript_391:3-389(-)
MGAVAAPCTARQKNQPETVSESPNIRLLHAKSKRPDARATRGPCRAMKPIAGTEKTKAEKGSTAKIRPTVSGVAPVVTLAYFWKKGLIWYNIIIDRKYDDNPLKRIHCFLDVASILDQRDNGNWLHPS